MKWDTILVSVAVTRKTEKLRVGLSKTMLIPKLQTTSQLLLIGSIPRLLGRRGVGLGSVHGEASASPDTDNDEVRGRPVSCQHEARRPLSVSTSLVENAVLPNRLVTRRRTIQGRGRSSEFFGKSDDLKDERVSRSVEESGVSHHELNLLRGDAMIIMANVRKYAVVRHASPPWLNQ